MAISVVKDLVIMVLSKYFTNMCPHALCTVSQLGFSGFTVLFQTDVSLAEDGWDIIRYSVTENRIKAN